MLVYASKLLQFPILSLHIGGPVATVDNVIVDPRKMKIVGFFVGGPLVNGDTGNIVQTEIVREFSFAGMIVNSIDEFTSRGEVVALDKVIETGFRMEGLKVVTKKGTKLGKVIDYTFDSTDYRIMQIVVQRPALKALLDPELVISRKEIVEISNEKIVVKDEEEKIRQRALKEDFVPNFVNPFREPNFAKTDNQTPDERDS